jgi:hypothetical protein
MTSPILLSLSAVVAGFLGVVGVVGVAGFAGVEVGSTSCITGLTG